MTKRKNFSGFTTVELLAILAIMGIMLSVTLVSLSKNSTTNKVQAAQREVASAIKMAQSYALQGKTVAGTVPKYWGFKVANDSITYKIIYADGSGYSSAESYTLSNGVTISPKGDPDSMITFSVPNATVTLPSGSSLLLTLSLGSISKTITITSGGVVTEN